MFRLLDQGPLAGFSSLRGLRRSTAMYLSNPLSTFVWCSCRLSVSICTPQLLSVRRGDPAPGHRSEQCPMGPPMSADRNLTKHGTLLPLSCLGTSLSAAPASSLGAGGSQPVAKTERGRRRNSLSMCVSKQVRSDHAVLCSYTRYAHKSRKSNKPWRRHGGLVVPFRMSCPVCSQPPSTATAA